MAKSTADLIRKIGGDIIELLLEKNEAYGDTANNPVNIFSKLGSIEGIRARIDDKLSRIKNRGINDQTEDSVSDLIGYLILLKIELIKTNKKNEEKNTSRTKKS
tara:strand:+ start:2039 stop:2350 length:312 start_codon:yes stop_codon:yes gene_type:complete